MPKRPLKNSTIRHELILQKLHENGRIMIDELTRLTGVSGVTIRKDLKLLEDKNLLFPTKGGASLSNPYMIERPINEKELIHATEKEQIAKAALSIIGENDSIIIGSGTTVFAFAHALYPSRHLTVITPAVKVTLELCNRPNIQVLQLGGLIRPNSSSVAGTYAEEILESVSCGIFFMGVDGIDPDFGLSITNLAETSLDQKMIASAQRVAILADSSKFGKRGLGKVCDFDHIQFIITDNNVSKGMVKKIEEKGVKMILSS